MIASEDSRIEQGSALPDPKYGPASDGLASIFSLKLLIGFRSLVLVSIIAVLFSTRWPRLGLDLELGVLFGVVNMWLVMWANERLLAGRVGRSQRSFETFARLTTMGSFVALMMYWGPWWSFGIALLGFYMPVLLQLIELTKRHQTGKM